MALIKQMKCELLEIDGSFNVRDLGGYRGEGGLVIKSRRFIRAGSLSGLTPQGEEQLVRHGIRTVVDLRSNGEVSRQPDPVRNHSQIEYDHVAMLDYIQSNIDSGDFDTFPESLEVMYTGLLDSAQDQISRVFHRFAHADTAILFHCTAGKDRTGVISMLLLRLAGVDREIVAEDYSWSSSLIKPLMQTQAGSKFPSYANESRADTMLAVMEYLDKQYGGARQYLDKIGVSKRDQALILEKCFA